VRGHERVHNDIIGSGLGKRKPPGRSISQLDIETAVESVFLPDIQQQGHSQTVARENSENNAPFPYFHDYGIRLRIIKDRSVIFCQVFYRYPA
jgi:hypothetical protein